MGFRLDGVGNDNFFNKINMLGSEIKFSNDGFYYKTSSKNKKTSINKEDNIGVEIKGYNDSSINNKEKNEYVSSSNKVDTSKGYREVDIIGGYKVQISNDTSWKDIPLKDEDIIFREENSHQNGTEITTKYSDGTIVKEYYSGGKKVRQEIRYSGDPSNPEEGDVRSTKSEYSGNEGSVIHSDSDIWVDIPGIGSGWYNNLVSSPFDYRVFDKDGNEIPYNMDPSSDYQRIKNDSRSIYPPSQGFFDVY